MQVCNSLQTDNHASTQLLSFYRPDALPATQPTASKHYSKRQHLELRVVVGAEVEVGAGGCSNQVELDGSAAEAAAAGAQWRMNEAAELGDVVQVEFVLRLKRRHKLEVDARGTHDVHLTTTQLPLLRCT